MARIVVVRPPAGAAEFLPLEAWRALTRAPVICAPGDDLGARLRAAGYRVSDIDAAEGVVDAEPSAIAGRNLLVTHTHGAVPPGLSALADALADRARELDEVAYVARDDLVVKAIVQRAMDADVEVEFVLVPAPRGARLLDLVQVMARLRGPGGCPWDAEQTHQTLAKHLLEETYELLEAIDSGDEQHIAEELGDILLQVVFHAQMGSDVGAFDVDDVAQRLIDKLVRRHPHVFGDVQVEGAREVVANWDKIKAAEKKEGARHAIPEALPALAYAQSLQRRAGAAGFDWSDVEGALAKVAEEAGELARASDAQAREDELGDLLFSIVALARHLDVDAESALRRSARRFRDRFRAVERLAEERGLTMGELDDARILELWDEVKGR